VYKVETFTTNLLKHFGIHKINWTKFEHFVKSGLDSIILFEGCFYIGLEEKRPCKSFSDH